MRLVRAAFAALLAGCSCGIVIEPDAGAREDATPAHGFIAISTTAATNCALHSDGRAVCWGEAFPEPFVFDAAVDRVSAGANQACVLRGTMIECVSATYDPDNRNVRVPPGEYQDVSTAVNATCGVRLDGTVACWGFLGEAAPPPTTEAITSVRVSADEPCVLTAGGAAACWYAIQPPYRARTFEGTFIDVASAGSYAACAVRSTGEIVCTTCYDDPALPEADRCPDSTWLERVGSGPGGLFVRISASAFLHMMCGIRADGTLECWGEDYASLATSQPDARFRDVAVGTEHVCGVTIDGTIQCWGFDSFGQTRVPRDDLTLDR